MFEKGQVRMEPVRDEDVVQNADGTYTINYRFTVMPKIADTLYICAVLDGMFEQGETTMNEQREPYSEELEAVHLSVLGKDACRQQRA